MVAILLPPILFSLHAGLHVRLRRGLEKAQLETSRLEEVSCRAQSLRVTARLADDNPQGRRITQGGPSFYPSNPVREGRHRRSLLHRRTYVGLMSSERQTPSPSSGSSQDHPAGRSWRPVGMGLTCPASRLGCVEARCKCRGSKGWSRRRCFGRIRVFDSSCAFRCYRLRQPTLGDRAEGTETLFWGQKPCM